MAVSAVEGIAGGRIYERDAGADERLLRRITLTGGLAGRPGKVESAGGEEAGHTHKAAKRIGRRATVPSTTVWLSYRKVGNAA